MKNALLYLFSLVIFLAIDMTWLGVVAKKFYWGRLGNLMTDQLVWPAIVVFYFIYMAGVFYFAIHPAVKEQSYSLAIINGVILGVLAYATYDLTNMATLKGWSWQVVFVDIIWGGIITGTVSYLTYLLHEIVWK